MLVDGPHFRATDEGELVFLVSDGDSSRRPTEHVILEPEEENGTLQQNYYLRIPLDHPDSHRWRTEIAKYLAPLVLGTMMGTLPWTLADFPQGYVLLLHKSPRRAEPSKARRDFYLYGATDVPSFASPFEFVKHAEWLMRGAHRTLDTRRSPRCPCKYCSQQHASPGRDGEGSGRSSGGGGANLKNREKKQSAISRGLRRVRAGILARIKSGGEDVDEDMDDGGAEEEGEAEAEAEAEEVAEEVAEAEAEAEAIVDPDPDAVEAGAKDGVGVDTNVVNTEPINAISATDHGGND